MCKFCNIEVEDINWLKEETIDIKVGDQTIGKYELNVTFDHKSDDEYELSADLWINDFDNVLLSASIPIKYCPFCGRKLHND